MSNKARETKSAPPAPSPELVLPLTTGNAATIAPASPNKCKSSQQCHTSPQLPSQLTPIQFHISNLEGNRRYSSCDHQVTMILELHGLYDLVSTVYDIARSEKLTHDSIHSHWWDVTYDGKRYYNGWSRKDPRNGKFDKPAGKWDVDVGERRMFLELSARKGHTGHTSGSSLEFDFEVVRVSDETVALKDTLVKIPQSVFISNDLFHTRGGGEKGNVDTTYPKITKVSWNLSGTLSEDWISEDVKAQSARLRDAWVRYNSGLNSWKRDYRTGHWIPSKPLSPPWGGGDEHRIMGLLISSNCKFKKSWNTILQHTFVNRTESSTSMKWYQLAKKDHFMVEHVGRGMTNESRIQLAKRLAKRHLDVAIKRGRTAKDPDPDARIEALLRKRGLITEDMDKFERKRLCCSYRYMDDSDVDED